LLETITGDNARTIMTGQVVVRLFYQWPLIVTGLGFNIANLSGSKRLLTATAAFQNEPFTSFGPTCS
jgi:hypothetical protein